MKLPTLFADTVTPQPSSASFQQKDHNLKPIRRSRKDWDLLLKQWETSGLTQQKFCEQNNINLRTFVGHRSKQQAKLQSKKKLLPINVSDPVTCAPPTKGSDIVLKLTSGAELVIPPQCDKTGLKELFIMLGVCRC